MCPWKNPITMKAKIVSFLFISLILAACKSDDLAGKKYMLQNFQDTYLKKITFPDSLVHFIGSDKIKSRNIKILFTGNMNCSPCVITILR